jgi:O-acetyl-ADP-ribose deacetylase (regulator of RNase III)
MRHIAGDLIALAKAGHFDVIAHGCNCFNVMGAGLAAQIARHFPEAAAADARTAPGDPAKLGTLSEALVVIGAHRLHVVNAYTQHHYAGDGVLVDYAAVASCMAHLKRRHAGRRIGLPQIGAGLAGGHWPTIEEIIRSALAGEDLTIVTFKPQT